MRFKKRTALAVAALSCALALTCAVGCSQSSKVEEETLDPEVETQYLPKVYTDNDGDLIQLVPDEERDDAYYFRQAESHPYNTYYAKADERGCKACHDNLQLLLEESGYEHCLISGVETEWTITQCLGCHSTNAREYFTISDSFGTMMHGLHMDKASCWNCHDSSTTYDSSNSTMYLWESVKHQKLRGITDIKAEEMDGDFSFSQDLIIDQKNLPNLNAHYYEWDYLRSENTKENLELSEQTLNDWTISVSGAVDKPTTFKLTDLMADAPKETTTIKWNCVMNAFGGSGVGQVEVTGVPLSYIAEAVGVKDSATTIWCTAADGFCNYAPLELSYVKEHPMLLVYEINGEPVSWANGYPCLSVIGGGGCSIYTKQLTDIVYGEDESVLFKNWGWTLNEWNKEIVQAETIDWYNIPNVGLLHLKEGQIVKTGEPFAITGYADAYAYDIVAIELSMDRGATWKRFEIKGADVDKLITWRYEFTPTEDTAYTIDVRAYDARGDMSEWSVEKMFVAHSDLDNINALSLEEHEASADEFSETK